MSLAVKLLETNDEFSSVFDLEKRLIITSPWSPPTFLFLLEQVPADPCPSGDHEGRTITDITLLSTIFLLRPVILHKLGQYPTRILVLLREHGWGDSTSRIIVFSQQHLTHKGEITWSHPLSSGVTDSPSSPAGLSPSLRARFPHPEDSKISFLWRAYWLVGKINCLPETPTSPLEFLCEGP